MRSVNSFGQVPLNATASPGLGISTLQQCQINPAVWVKQWLNLWDIYTRGFITRQILDCAVYEYCSCGQQHFCLCLSLCQSLPPTKMLLSSVIIIYMTDICRPSRLLLPSLRLDTLALYPSLTDSVTDRETSYIARAPSVRRLGICTVSFRLVLFNVCGSN